MKYRNIYNKCFKTVLIVNELGIKIVTYFIFYMDHKNHQKLIQMYYHSIQKKICSEAGKRSYNSLLIW